MSQSFFEALGVASIERIHSQMLYWLFENSVLSTTEKISILQLINPNTPHYKSFKAITEHKNIDLLVKADNDLYIFENKIKSTEHSEQLKKYEGCKDVLSWNIEQEYFIYLTLINEEATSPKWKNIHYKDLYVCLKQFRRGTPLNPDDYILNEYIDSLKKLTSTIDAFMSDHRLFKNVFTDGKKKKVEKINDIERKDYSEEQKYVALNQLETILQRKLLFIIARKMFFFDGDYPNIGESHGTAFLDIDYKFSEVSSTSVSYVLGIQFQGPALKIFFYNKDFKGKATSVSQDIIDIYRETAKKYGYRFNKPRKNARVSISTRIHELWEMDLEEACRYYTELYKEARERVRCDILPYL